MAAQLIGMNQDEALTLVNSQDNHVDVLHSHVRGITAAIEAFQSTSFKGVMSDTLAARWHGEVRPELEKVLNDASEKQSRTTQIVGHQMDNLHLGANEIAGGGVTV